jgi:hypothetical protein
MCLGVLNFTMGTAMNNSFPNFVTLGARGRSIEALPGCSWWADWSTHSHMGLTSAFGENLAIIKGTGDHPYVFTL